VSQFKANGKREETYSGILEDESLSGGSNSSDSDSDSEKKGRKRMTASDKEQSMKSKYFVSNSYIEKIFDTMTCTYKARMEKLDDDIKDQRKDINLIFDELTKKIPNI
jgi:hypothetical protein